MNILLTRALQQVKPLESLLVENGYQPILFPTLKIKALQTHALKKHYDLLIFISVNAVIYGLEVLKTLSYHQIFAVGTTTAKKLADNGFKVDGFPQEKASSAALLAMPELQVLANKNILIFRGRGGRETLKETLGKHNTVEYIEIYQRTECQTTALHRTSLTQFLRNKQGIIAITSIENLSNMMTMIEKINANILQSIKAYRLVVFSQRIKTYAQSIGFKGIEVAAQTNDAGLLQAIKCIAKT